MKTRLYDVWWWDCDPETPDWFYEAGQLTLSAAKLLAFRINCEGRCTTITPAGHNPNHGLGRMTKWHQQ